MTDKNYPTCRESLAKMLNAIDEDRKRIVKLEQEVDKLYKAQKGFGGYLLNRYNEEKERK